MGGYELDNRGSIPVIGRYFSLHYHIQNVSEFKPASCPMENSFPGIKHEADNLSPYSGEFNNMLNIACTTSIRLHGVALGTGSIFGFLIIHLHIATPVKLATYVSRIPTINLTGSSFEEPGTPYFSGHTSDD
jgi:hypothetical protein